MDVSLDVPPRQIHGRAGREIDHGVNAAKGATHRTRTADVRSGYTAGAVAVKVDPSQCVMASKAFPKHTADQPGSTCHEYTHEERESDSVLDLSKAHISPSLGATLGLFCAEALAPALEMPHPADAVVMITADDAGVSWASLVAVVLLSWLGVALAAGTIIGHGIAFGTGSDSD
jgi:hypothetical protein